MDNTTSHTFDSMTTKLTEMKWDNSYIKMLDSSVYNTHYINESCEEVLIKLALNGYYVFHWSSLWIDYRYPPLLHSLMKFHLIHIESESNSMGEARAKCILTPLGAQCINKDLPFIHVKGISPIRTKTIYLLSSICLTILLYMAFFITSVAFKSSLPAFVTHPVTFSIINFIVSSVISITMTIGTFIVFETTEDDNSGAYSNEYVQDIISENIAPTSENFIDFLFNTHAWTHYPRQDFGYANLAINQILFNKSYTF